MSDQLKTQIRLPSGWLRLGDVQPLRGYCVLFADPAVHGLTGLNPQGQAQWGIDCARVGEALLKVLGADRINYETYGNVNPALHTHITPRFNSEPEHLKALPPRLAYDWDAAPVTDHASTESIKLLKEIELALGAL